MIDAVDHQPRELRISVPEPPSAAIAAIADFFDVPTDAVRFVDPEDQTTPEVVVRTPEKELLAADLDAVWEAVTTTAEVVRTASVPLSLLDELDVTTFRSQSVPQLVVASRYVERRAERQASGTLYACFQHLSRLENDLRTMVYYSVLAETDLEVHLFGVPDTELADTEGLVIHDIDSEELARTWLVAYDGDGVEAHKAALLCQEIAPRQYRGFWTHEAARVDEIIAYLTDTYLR